MADPDSSIKLIIADDHEIFRDGLKALLDQEPDLKVIAEAASGAQTREAMAREAADVVLMDIKMPDGNGIETTRFLKENYPETHILALSMYDEDKYIMEMLAAGATGYLLKNTSRQELLQAIHTLLKGETYFSPEVSSRLLNRYVKKEFRQEGSSPDHIVLTKREKEVLRLIAEELTNPEIGEKLFISRRTVDTHRKNLLQKTGAKNTAGLIRFAMEAGLLS
ncbi:MAG: response regulator transcription factor [Bacteroidia bacterium]|nr:response regulator transcription factor [Bacteroidia bacterium]